MPLANTIALTSLATANDELGLTSDAGVVDARVERYILQVSEACGKYCERTFRKESRVIPMRGSQTRRLVLPARPLVSIASIVVDGTTLDASDYAIEDAEAGIVYRAAGWLRPDSIVPWSIARDRMAGTAASDITVTYTGGFVLPGDGGTRTLPYDLEQACLMGVVAAFRQRGQDRNVASRATGDASIGYRLPNTIIGVDMLGSLPSEALRILDSYKQEPMVS